MDIFNYLTNNMWHSVMDPEFLYLLIDFAYLQHSLGFVFYLTKYIFGFFMIVLLALPTISFSFQIQFSL